MESNRKFICIMHVFQCFCFAAGGCGLSATSGADLQEPQKIANRGRGAQISEKNKHFVKCVDLDESIGET